MLQYSLYEGKYQLVFCEETLTPKILRYGELWKYGEDVEKFWTFLIAISNRKIENRIENSLGGVGDTDILELLFATVN